MTVSDVQKLNERIENIQTQRTKVESQRELLMSRLTKEVSDYEEKFGVKLKGSSVKDIMKAVSEEKKKVEKQIKEEYELKKQVVEAIDSGDIEKANSLLGVSDYVSYSEFDVEESDEADMDVEEVEEAEEVEEVEEDLGVDADEVEEADEVKDSESKDNDVGFDEDEDVEDSIDEDMVFGVDDEVDEEEVEVKPKKEVKKKTKSTTKNLGSTVDDTVKELDNKSDMFADMDDVDFDDFGFGDMLSGTKFGE